MVRFPQQRRRSSGANAVAGAVVEVADAREPGDYGLTL